MTPNDKKRRGLFLTIGLFILPIQLVINHFYGGITVKSFIVILVGWLISIGTVSYTHLTLPTTSRV